MKNYVPRYSGDDFNVANVHHSPPEADRSGFKP